MPQEKNDVKNLLVSQDFLAIPSTRYCLDLIVFSLFSRDCTLGNVRLKTAWFLLWNDNTLPRSSAHAVRPNYNYSATEFRLLGLAALTGEAIGGKEKSREMPRSSRGMT